eukprot:6441068-Amphidinium_carterae.1
MQHVTLTILPPWQFWASDFVWGWINGGKAVKLRLGLGFGLHGYCPKALIGNTTITYQMAKPCLAKSNAKAIRASP